MERMSEKMDVLRESDAVQEAGRLAALAVGECEQECRAATLLVVSELAENMVKYGALAPDQRAGTITVDVEDGLVRVRTTNVVESEADGQHVVDAVSRISTSDANELYRTRMRELLSDPALPRTRLGLLRVALEGGFRLTCSYRAKVLEIVAERRVDGQ
jgi:hypothetical protein